jgi:hypothetical protein
MSALEDSQDQDSEGAETSDEKEKKEKVLGSSLLFPRSLVHFTYSLAID